MSWVSPSLLEAPRQESTASNRSLERSIASAHLVLALFLLLGVDNLLLLRFLGIASVFAHAAVGIPLVLLWMALARSPWGASIPFSRLWICMGVAFAAVLLGGEGRIFYANTDWQIRDAILHDMVRWPWPVVYAHVDGPMLLRAPIGMYLLPALVGKAGGALAADWALLVQNALVLGVILALGSQLFPSRRSRLIALVVVLAFSGMDTIGVILARPSQLLPLTRNIDGYGGIQFDADLTNLFWVPQHALAGWLGALMFVLWRAERMSLGVFLAILPLTALWSPLGLLGMLPFAALAGVKTLLERRLRWADVGPPALACLGATVTFLYLATDSGRVGMQLYPVIPAVYLIVVLFDVVPFAAIALATGAERVGRSTVIVATVSLLAMPFLELGGNTDMRASIPALAVFAVISADLLAERRPRRLRSVLVLVLAIGAMTPLREVARAVAFRPPPPPQCDLTRAWQRSYANFPLTPYLARLSTVPALLRPNSPALVPTNTGKDPSRPWIGCWSRPWQVPRLGDPGTPT